MTVVLRQARRADIPAMHRVRMSVQENRLSSRVLSDSDYVAAIERNGCGWVIEHHGVVVAFAVADSRDGSVWALFVEPGHEGHGYGRRLHGVTVDWLRAQGFARLWLTTEIGTRAERFYERAGWTRAASSIPGETRFELVLSDARPEARI